MLTSDRRFNHPDQIRSMLRRCGFMPADREHFAMRWKRRSDTVVIFQRPDKSWGADWIGKDGR